MMLVELATETAHSESSMVSVRSDVVDENPEPEIVRGAPEPPVVGDTDVTAGVMDESYV